MIHDIVFVYSSGRCWKAAHAMFRIEMLCVHSSHVFYTSFISFFTVDNSSHVSFVGLPQC